VSKTIFVPTRNGVTGDREDQDQFYIMRKLYFSPNIIKAKFRNEMDWIGSMLGEDEKCKYNFDQKTSNEEPSWETYAYMERYY
jgi:hypothetical protein